MSRARRNRHPAGRLGHRPAARRTRCPAERRTRRSEGSPSTESQAERLAANPWARNRTYRARPRRRDCEQPRPPHRSCSRAPSAPGSPGPPSASAARRRDQQRPPRILRVHQARPAETRRAGTAGTRQAAPAGSRERDSPWETGILPREGRLSPRRPQAPERPARPRRFRAPGPRQREHRGPEPRRRRPGPPRAPARRPAAERATRPRSAREPPARTPEAARSRAACPGCAGRPSRSPWSARRPTSRTPPPGPVVRSGRRVSLRATPRPTHGSRGRWSAVSEVPTRRDSFDRAPGRSQVRMTYPAYDVKQLFSGGNRRQHNIRQILARPARVRAPYAPRPLSPRPVRLSRARPMSRPARRARG